MYKKLLKDMLEGKIPMKIKESLQPRGIEVEPESLLEKSFLGLGKKYVMWRYHDFNVSLTKEYINFRHHGFLIIYSIHMVFAKCRQKNA